MEIKISQDIRKFKTRDIGSFSFKEAGFIAVGAALGFMTYKLSGSFEAALVPLFVVVAFGFFKPMGMSFWEFIRTVVRDKLVTQVYINETDFVYEPDEFDELYGEEIAIPSDWNEVIQTEMYPESDKDRKVREKRERKTEKSAHKKN